MKSSLLSYLLIISLSISNLPLVHAQVPAERLISPEQINQVKETAAPALEKTFETRKTALTAGVNASLIAVADIEKNINNSEVLTPAQKQELLPLTAGLTKTLTDYKSAITAAKNSDELMQATKNFLITIKNNKEKIREAVSTVIMISVEATMKEAENYFQAAAEISGVLKLCGTDTSKLDQLIEDGNGDLADLQELYNDIMSDQKITSDEKAKVKSAAKLAKDLTVAMAEIGQEILLLAEKCPAAQWFLNETN